MAVLAGLSGMHIMNRRQPLVLNVVDTDKLEIVRTVTEDCVTKLSLLPTARRAAGRLMSKSEPESED